MLLWLMKVQDPYCLIVNDGENGAMFVPAGVDKYQVLDREFRELLFILVVAIGGAPPRGTEISSLKYKNTQHGRQNIFVSSGQVILVTQYNKTDSMTRKPKVSQAIYSYQIRLF